MYLRLTHHFDLTYYAPANRATSSVTTQGLHPLLSSRNMNPKISSFPKTSETSCLKLMMLKGLIVLAFAVYIHTKNQASICPFALYEVLVHTVTS